MSPSDSRAFGREGRAGTDVETVVASVKISSEEDLQALEYFALQLVRVLFCVVSVENFGTGSVESNQALIALGGLWAFLEIIKAARAKARSSTRPGQTS